MSTPPLETDYLVIGAGAIGMAFVDSLLTSSPDAQVVIVDRHHAPGGHWNDAYPFVRLHQPASYYGVNSEPLGTGATETQGLNAGMEDLASGPELLAYFHQVMQRRFLPSGRVHYLPMSRVVDDGETIESLATGRRQAVRVRRKVVDGTHSAMQVPSTTPPRYAVAPGVHCAPLNALARLQRPHAQYVVVGAGKTGMDACLWLLQQQVDPDTLRWIVPRDPWVLDRANVQASDDHFLRTWSSLSQQLEVAAAAEDFDDLARRLEEAGEWMRLDPAVQPAVFHGAILSRAELAALRRIRGIVRMGHVLAVEPGHLRLEQGSLALEDDVWVIDCSATGIPSVPAVPVWQGRRITPQWVRSFGTVFSAALIAHIEVSFEDDAQKNALCTPIVPPTLASDWVRMQAVTLDNQLRWSRHPSLLHWLAASRLNALVNGAGRVRPDDAERLAVLQRYKQALKPGAAGLTRLLATLP